MKQKRGYRKVYTGVVTSNKMDKTIVVKVSRRCQHPVYKKVITRYTKCYVHDEAGQAKVGDVVTIMETRPLSKLKRWRVIARQQNV